MDKTYERKDAERMMPLVRSIGREIKERTRAIEALEQRHRAASGELDALFDAELSSQRRELRQVTNELERLGLSIDAKDPLRILIPGTGGSWAYEGQLDDTQFRAIHST
jgi:DNA-binding transcriptional ArsR family regulator